MSRASKGGVCVASLNLHAGRTSEGEHYSVGDAIESLEADVVLLQENWRPEGSDSLAHEAAEKCGYRYLLELDLLAESTMYDLGILDRPAAGGCGAWGLAIMSRLPLLHRRDVDLGRAPRDVGPRVALVADLGEAGRPLLRLVNTHLTHQVVHGPGQLRRLLAAVAVPWPVAVVGDLNMCRPTIYLARPYRPAVRGRTWPAHRPVAQLDHVLVGPGVQVAGGTVMPHVGSDHLPIRVRLALPPDEVLNG
jgi:endonuclease/exonuclease/phosphatase family metal-dependent hydrolase